ncbi:MAG: NADH-quinone oxidoreductase subunit L, partial [bacterium]|nr:NADH-quinone oxidoreductase subunit L [bacterium]
MLSYVWLTVALPALGWLINGLFGARLSRKLSGSIACAAVGGAFLVALGVMADYITNGYAESSPFQIVTLWPWIHSGTLKLDMAFLVDPLSITMMLLITGVGFLIHVYSTSYMSHDDGYPRFFAYLNLFVAMMMLLVLGANTVLMFVGWEGVGLCSYLLIGFWYRNMENANAGMKAFVVNRIGDAGVLLGMFMLAVYFGSLNFADIITNSHEVFGAAEAWVPTAIALLLFLGACGKSAQIPLHIWLPDAMAGPTPVSALIHAATMVTAGVYMVTRLNPVFEASPTAGFVVAVIGCATAFMAATIALTQSDIKKVLAYSTVSQLGFMFLAAGVGAYWVAMFHVLTHAFFKACLFLGSGSVIHAMHEEQDTRVMGGLARYMKVTYYTFLISTFAIAGIIPFAGFFSKDEILWQVATWEGRFPWAPALLYGVALLTAFMTAFYMGRVTFKTFLGKSRWTEHFVKHHHHPHESSPAMTIPLIVLAFLATFGGFALFVPAWLF